MHVFFPSAPEGRAGRSAVVVRRVGRRRRDGRIEIDLHVRRASDQAAVILHVCAQAGSVGKAGWGWDGGGDGGVGLRGGGFVVVVDDATLAVTTTTTLVDQSHFLGRKRVIG